MNLNGSRSNQLTTWRKSLSSTIQIHDDTVFADLVTKKKLFPDLHLADKFVLFSFFNEVILPKELQEYLYLCVHTESSV